MWESARMEGCWAIRDDAGHVRLRSGRIGLISIDVQAPVVGGSLTVDGTDIELEMVLALDRLRTRNPLLQAAARSLVASHRAQELRYLGSGLSTAPWRVDGVARAGNVEVALGLLIRPVGSAGRLSQVDLLGSAEVGTVHLPLPGLGTVRDFGFDVEARLDLGR